ncbi:MAG: cytochrome ubiquinol oxidase subunit I [Capnocytophaga leadbetteri]|jgi:cytochrome bd ubiquinol oxidase subunit I|uniref:Cytochrome bd-I ubiquinol oxidase subunit 1 apoprotein n=1 Tax=Capnocytophaga leadbetteri TaxID=327575 RepID=A0A2T5XZ52_9FLAO|nr:MULTISPECIES: cytochrome ubiquinol oxidase subunit I [Capnocytophaga]KHE70787.1 bacterial cytochrome ubiquinol oxidase [Capnocytophaga sp. oral taxon 329 str. F0087]PTX08804.1 cytochrome bd-I ubiquinol oxidase subunit 1 apoprotein [Capnocytophaga leadbetteri]QGS18360.1 cytochrome ubiquinol oxidase subunit I [Capnocytophaga sp. FDAARGOS_737]
METEILARIQFALTIAFHYIYPPLSIGLGLLMVIFKGIYLRTGKVEYNTLARFWTRIFSLTFGIGVATGIVMEFEFGTNWATYSRYVGDIFGSALAAEGVFAFALESTCLGIVLFGWNKIKPVWHFLATLGVFLGSMCSAVWIVIANSWQQTPAGYVVAGEGMQAKAVITDFWAMVFNPSSVDRIWHVWQGAFLAGIFLVLSVHAWYLLKGRHVEISKKAFKVTLIVGTIFSLLQLASGHSSAEGVAKNQPEKLAAMEGHFRTEPADLYLFGWVDKKNEVTHGVKIPNGLTYMLHYDTETPVIGLDQYPMEDRPGQVNAVFQFYHIMVAIGMFLIALTVFASFLLWRGKLYDKRWLLRIFVWAVILPQIGNQVGWFAAEMGRQPWIVYKLLRTSDALSKAVTAHQILFAIILFTIVYTILFILFIYLLKKKIVHGIDEHEEQATITA